MSFPNIEFRIKVFISSKCGGKYTIARKALKALLLGTGLTEVYCFETTPASSQDVIESYLSHVDDSNLCVFLVDNKDGVPDAVLKEERRAKEKGLKLIYLFCDEEEKNPTVMQEEIKTSFSQKYYIVHEFSDIAIQAYEAIIQDVINYYKRKQQNVISEPKSEVAKQAALVSNSSPSDTFNLLPSNLFSQLTLSKEKLINPFMPSYIDTDEAEESELDQVVSKFMNFVLRREQFDEDNFAALQSTILSSHADELFEFLTERFSAYKAFCKAQYVDSLYLLKSALTMVASNERIPNWLGNDVAHDILYVRWFVENKEERLKLSKEGEDFFKNHQETKYYPMLDRHNLELERTLRRKYSEYLNLSPHTTQLGGLGYLFEEVVNNFCIALTYGSIAQTESIRSDCRAVLTFLCEFEESHDLYLELVRLSIVDNDNKKVEELLRTERRTRNLNCKDLLAIMGSISNIPDEKSKLQAQYILLTDFGYLFEETDYQEICSKLVAYSFEWCDDNNRSFELGRRIFDFYKHNVRRLSTSSSADFIISCFEKTPAYWFDSIFGLVDALNFETVDIEKQEKIQEQFIKIIKDEEQLKSAYGITRAIIMFSLTASINIESLESVVAEKMPDFYETKYLLALSRNDDDNSIHIQRYIKQAHEINETQGNNGVYSAYLNEPLDVIFDLITPDQEIDDALQDSLINIVYETLKAPRQTIKAKMSAFRLLGKVYILDCNKEEKWPDRIEYILENKEVFLNARQVVIIEKETMTLLKLSYYLLFDVFGISQEINIAEYIFSISQENAYELIQVLKLICSIIDISVDNGLPTSSLTCFAHFAIHMSTHRERDVKFYAIKCLIGLTHYDVCRRIALMRLSKIMDIGTSVMKTSIVSRVSKIKDEDFAYTKYILQKAKIDDDYLVRQLAEQEEKRLCD